MTKTFVPHKPEVMIAMKVSGKEADMIKRIRKVSFGKIVVHKVDNLLVRIEITKSQLLEESRGLDLANR